MHVTIYELVKAIQLHDKKIVRSTKQNQVVTNKHVQCIPILQYVPNQKGIFRMWYHEIDSRAGEDTSRNV